MTGTPLIHPRLAATPEMIALQQRIENALGLPWVQFEEWLMWYRDDPRVLGPELTQALDSAQGLLEGCALDPQHDAALVRQHVQAWRAQRMLERLDVAPVDLRTYQQVVRMSAADLAAAGQELSAFATAAMGSGKQAGDAIDRIFRASSLIVPADVFNKLLKK